MRNIIAKVWLIACLLGAVATATWGYLSPSTTTKETRIDQMTVGRWVLSDNPIEADDTQFGREVDPSTWRMIHLEAPKTDGSSSDVWLLRPESWLKEQWASHHAPHWVSLIPATDPATGEEGYQLALREDLKSVDGQRLPGPKTWVPPYNDQQLVDQQMHIQVPECGISGWARVLSIGECPQVSARPGPRFQVVTGTFKHHSKKVIDVRIDGLAAPIGATPNHPFWSEDKQEFVRADQLQPGERLRQADGNLTQVVSLTPRSGEHDVYNIEVQIDHAYHVGASGVLVHNPGVLPIWCPNSQAWRNPLTGQYAKPPEVYRVWGGGSRPNGHFYSPHDPRLTPGYRNIAGLPPQNSGEFLNIGRVVNGEGLSFGPAAPIGGNVGGLTEIQIFNLGEQFRLDQIVPLRPPL